jgi:type II secretory pathway pseudopilin PulG
MKSKNQKAKKILGFTLIEAVVGIAIFGVLTLGIIQIYTLLSRTVKANREKTILTNLANQKLEVGRNLPYSQIGTLTGNPNGVLPDQSNPQTSTIENIDYQIYYEVTYIDDPADGTILAGTDPSPNDYKQLKMFVRNTSTSQITTFVTNVAPRGLESLTNAGAIKATVINSTGQPVSGANVHIEKLDGTIVLDRTSSSSGEWIEVGLPAAVNGYRVVVTKSGYSTDQTYPITVSNPNPVKPDPTVINGQVTQITFSIDLLSDLTIRTLDSSCQPLSGVGVNVRGDKLIGTNPNVYKFNNNYASVAGQIALIDIEWDNYTPTLLVGEPYTVYGTSPIQNINVLPDTSQTFTLILGPYSVNSLLVIVKNAAGTPLEGASVHLRKGGSVPQDYYGTTGGSVWVQNDWTGGAGQADFSDVTRYFADDGFIDINSQATGVELLKVSGQYVPNGWLESSTFDTGTSQTSFTTLLWQPTSQDPATTLRFQIASNNDNSTWNYLGPDGTASTYYTTPGSSISSAHSSDRYVRYKAYLSTTDDRQTPVLTSVDINYVSGCFTPGQSIFPNLTAGNNYDLEVSLAGFQTQTINAININGNNVLEVVLTP